MVNAEPTTLEEALDLLKQKELELSRSQNIIDKQDNLIQKQKTDLERADAINTKNKILLKTQKRSLASAQAKVKNVRNNFNKKKEECAKQAKEIKRITKEYKELERKFNELQAQRARDAANTFVGTTEKIKRFNDGKSYIISADESDSSDKKKEEETKKTKSGNKEVKIRKKKTSVLSSCNLPVKRYEEELKEPFRVCPVCGHMMRRVRSHKTQRIVHVPSYEYIEEYIYYTYECTNCYDEVTEVTKVKSCEKSMIEGGITSPSLLAHVFTSKYVCHTPFYCQSQVYNWQHIELCRQNFSNWQIKVYEKLKPLENYIFKLLKKSRYLIMDETPYKVQKINQTEREKEKWKNQADNDAEKKDLTDDNIEVSMKQCYVWVTIGECKGHKIVKYSFRWTRCGTFAKEMLNGFEGFALQADGFPGYDCAIRYHNEEHPDKTVSRCSCNSHSRRMWTNILKGSKKDVFANEVVSLYANIFKIEDDYREKYEKGLITEDEFIELRRTDSMIIFRKLHKKLKDMKGKARIFSGPTYKAINYFLNQYKGLIKYLDFSYLTPSSNEVERAIRPFVLTRSVSMFGGSGDGSDSSCMLTSLIEMCRNEEINPEDYLRCLFEQFPKIDTSDETQLEAMLPWNLKITPFKARGEWVKDETYERLKESMGLE